MARRSCSGVRGKRKIARSVRCHRPRSAGRLTGRDRWPVPGSSARCIDDAKFVAVVRRSLLPPSSSPVWLAAFTAAAIGGCTSEDAPPTWNGEVHGIVDAKCAGCHRPSGIGPMPLTTYEEVTGLGAAVRASIESGSMPPWQAEDGCNDYLNDFSLTEGERAFLDAWFAAGSPLGDEERAPEQPLVDPLTSGIRVDEVFEAAPQPWVPSRTDEYRCFAIRWPFATSKFITGFDMIPGDPSNVHHVNIFLNPPSDEADFVAIDEEDPEPGYSCSRGDRVLTSALVGAWAPGASGLRYPEGTGQLVEPGSSITLEIHYATGNGVPDASSLAVQLDDVVARRAFGAGFWWFNNWDDGGMLIPAGQASVTHDVTVDPSLILSAVAPWMTERSLEIHVAALHMHQLGSSGEVVVRSPVGDTCLVKIPRWDFRWQMGYSLRTPATLFLGEDQLYLRCTWDNSPANQPLVDGAQAAPRDVNWGGGTDDEMCIGFLYLVPATP